MIDDSELTRALITLLYEEEVKEWQLQFGEGDVKSGAAEYDTYLINHSSSASKR